MSKITAFTLLELLITLILLTLLSLLMLPDYRALKELDRTNSVMNQLYQAIFWARSQAIKQHQLITLCGSSDGYHCNGAWSQGYLFFLDPHAAGTPTQSSQILRVFKPIKGQGVIIWKGYPERSFVQINARGFTREENGTFRYCPADRDSHYARALILTQSGRIRISSLDSQGRRLKCL